MVYLTAGIADSYQEPDIGLESAITKLYCTDSLRISVDQCLAIIAMGEYSNILDQKTQSYLNDLSLLNHVLGTNDILKMYVAINGILVAGSEFGNEVKKLRNPFMHPGIILKKILTSHRLARSASRKVPEHFFLWEHVHPSLNDPATILEQLSIKFVMCVKSALGI